MRVVAIVQARTGSTRLPGKVLADLGGAPMLVRLLDRLRVARRLDDVIVATSDRHGDDAVAELASRADVACFRGSEGDVLGRIHGAAREARADAIVRITGDCPLVDPSTVDLVIGALDSSVDYASNVLRRTFPRGLDVEALHSDTLARLDRMATSTPAREHVTWLAYRERPELFVLRSVEQDGLDWSELNWSVDTTDDLERVRALYERFDLGRHLVPWQEMAQA